MVDEPTGGKRERTRARLQSCSLELFERRGFDRTTVAQIAEVAGVTPMTFFRHFKTKAHVLLDDPFDPVIAASIARQDTSLRPLVRIVAGVREAWAALSEPTTDIQRRRVRVVADTPSLLAEMQANNAKTEQLIVQQLVADGTERLVARAAAAAVLAAITAAFLEWSQGEALAIGDALDCALTVVGGSDV